MATVFFDNDDVAAEAGTDPWDRYDSFKDEIDVEEIAEAAVSYSNAANEAVSAEDLARLATEESASSADIDGMSLTDAEERLKETEDQLQGDQLDGAFTALRAVVVAAEEALDANWEEMYGSAGTPSGRNLFDMVQKCRSDAHGEIRQWERNLQSAVDSFNARILQLETAPTVQSPHPATTETSFGPGILGNVTAVERPGGWGLPDSVYEGVRQTYLTKAADYADVIDGKLVDHIEDYRAEVTKRGGDLEEEGYSLGESPLGVWYTPEMAEYHAEMFQQASGEDPPNWEEMELATRFMDGVSGRLFDENGNLRDPDAEMTPAERLYLSTFFNNVDEDSLAVLGEAEEIDGNPLRPEAAEARKNIANGINTLMNDEVGGVDLESRDGWREVPESLKPLMDPTLLDGATQYEGPERIALYNAYGNIMEQATVPPGDVFGEKVGDAAIEIQRAYENRWHGSYDGLSLNGANQMMSMVAMNPEASARILLDEGRADTVLSLDWPADEGEGAGDLIRSGTIAEEGAEPTANQIAAAKNVLEMTGNGPQTSPGDDDESPGPNALGLQEAVVDTGLTYLDFLARAGESDGGQIHDVYGNKVDGFALSADAYNGFFDFIAGAEDDPKNKFYGGTYLHASNTMHEAVTEGYDIDRVTENLGRIHGALDAGEYQKIMNETNSENAAETEMALNWLNGHRVATGVVTAGGLIPGASPFTTLGGAGLALLGTQLPQADTVDTYTEVSEQRRKDALEEGVDMRLWMLEGAATASGTMSEEEIAELHGYYSNDPDGDHEQLIYQSLEEAEEAAGYNGSPYWNLRESRGG